MNDESEDSATASAPAPLETSDGDDETVRSTDGDEDEEAEDGESSVPKAAASASTTSSLRQVYTAEAEAYAKESNLLFYEASAKTGQNVGDLFTEIGTSSLIDLRPPSKLTKQPKPFPSILSLPSQHPPVVEAALPMLQVNQMAMSTSARANRRRRAGAARCDSVFGSCVIRFSLPVPLVSILYVLRCAFASFLSILYNGMYSVRVPCSESQLSITFLPPRRKPHRCSTYRTIDSTSTPLLSAHPSRNIAIAIQARSLVAHSYMKSASS